MSRKTLVYYHGGTLDGKAAAYAAWRKFGDTAEFCGVDYATIQGTLKSAEWLSRDIYFLDISPPPEIDLSQHKPNSITFIHNRLVTENNIFESDLVNVVETGSRCTCVTAWRYLFEDSVLPMTFRYIEDQEIGRDQYRNSYYVCLGLNIRVAFDDFKEFLDRVNIMNSMEDVIAQLSADGMSYKSFLDSLSQNYMSKTDTYSICGMNLPIINIPKPFVNMCLSMLVKQTGLAMSYTDHGRKRMWSIRSYKGAKVSAGDIAKAFGGFGTDTYGGFSTSYSVTPDYLEGIYSSYTLTSKQG